MNKTKRVTVEQGIYLTGQISYINCGLSVAWDLGEFINKERKKKEKQTTVSQTQC